ncbi:hypothetical protein AX17_006204 [Amanita inopinata Kibby_2008]|nr:hypothetical protein AX17_006204 [Amanita inopinata Kibby_2008]
MDAVLPTWSSPVPTGPTLFGMNPEDKQAVFTLPLVFSNSCDGKDPVEVSLAQSNASILRFWGCHTPSNIVETNSDLVGAGILGCYDGSMFLFHQVRPKSVAVNPPVTDRLRPRRTASPLDLTRALSRSTSPPSAAAPFHLSPMSNVVSGITTEKVEAPKVFVDFEDEPDKLKGLLEGRAPKEKLSTVEMEITRASHERSSTSNSENASLKGKERPRSVFSAGTPPIYSTKSASTPTSPQDPQLSKQTQDDMLVGHIISQWGGADYAIRAIVPVQSGRLFVALRESGDVRVYLTHDGTCMAAAHVDDIPLQSPKGVKDTGLYHDVCTWTSLKCTNSEESILLVASAAINTSIPSALNSEQENSSSSERSKMVIFELSAKDESGVCPVKLIKICQWTYDGPVEGIELLEANDMAMSMLVISSSGAVALRHLKYASEAPPTESHTPESIVGIANSLALPNPFKAMRLRYLEQFPQSEGGTRAMGLVADEDQVLGKISLGDPLLGVRTQHSAAQVTSLAWSRTCIAGFACRGHNFQVLFHQSLCGITELAWVNDDLYAVIYDNRVECYKLQAVDANNDSIPSDKASLLLQPSHQFTLATGLVELSAITPLCEAVFTRVSDNGHRHLFRALRPNKVNGSGATDVHILWKPPVTKDGLVFPTSLLPLNTDTVIQGYADGYLRQSDLSHLCNQFGQRTSSIKTSDSPINGKITWLQMVQNPRTKERFIISGACDGSIAFWTVNNLKLCARWTVFTTSLSRVVQLPDGRTGPLRGCLLCVSQDGTIAIVAIDDFQFLYIIPGSVTPLRRICVGETNLLLIYGDRRARLWDTQSKEFWRSLSLDKAEELLSQGGWTELFLDRPDDAKNPLFNSICDGYQGLDSVSSLSLDLENFIYDSAVVMKTISTNREQTKAIYAKVDQLKLLLSFLLTPGLNSDIDTICREKLNIPDSSASVGFSSLNTHTLYHLKDGRDPWCISGDVSAARVVSIVCILRTLSLFKEYIDSAKTVTTFYLTSLVGHVGPHYQPASLSLLALLWLRSSAELRQSCRVVFDASIVRLSDDEANILVEQWQHLLPCLHMNIEKESITSALALYLCGYLAVDKYSIMSTDALRDISRSIVDYLQDEKSLYRALAIDLCSRGFHVWQHYIDAMEILRSLFTLATNSRKDSISVQNVAAQARSAVLHIASNNTPLFMTTLGLDVLNPPNVEHRRSVLQIVAFLIRKRPLVLHPNLPRLMEAVVKSLDPVSTVNREAVLDAATDIIRQVVNTFPNVDFHGASQRLVVGSNEGAIVMYDLKTATRLYVLEGHKKKITACSFSPDGRRLVTLSLDESVLLVWKVGSSFTSFFNPGAPPRQGHGGSLPFKTLKFHVGDTSQYSESLDSVQFDWVADRSVKVKIGQNTLSFST